MCMLSIPIFSGIPSLIRFLKSIKCSSGVSKCEQRCHSRSSSLASLSLQPLPSPTTANSASTPTTATANTTNQLESFDPSLSFLNNFPANQIDDLENVLLPHLHTNNEDDQQRRSKSPTIINTDNNPKSGNGSGIRAANEDEVKSLREREKSDSKCNSSSKKVFRPIRPQDDVNNDKKIASEPVILQPDQSEDDEDHDQGQGQHHSSDNEDDAEERENVAANNKKQVNF